MSRANTVVLALAVLCAAPHAAGYRTAADLDELGGADSVRWDEDRIPFRLHRRTPDGTYLDELERAVSLGFARWSEADCSALSFSLQGITYDAGVPDDQQNTVEWLSEGWVARGFAPDAAAVTDIAYERGADQRWRIVEADVYVNGDGFRWVLSGTPPEGYRDVSSVLTHEAGHVLGLLHPCEPGGQDGAPDCAASSVFSSTTMYPLYDPEQSELSADDIAGVCALYPRPTCDEIDCPAGTRCVDGRCRELCQGDVCEADELCSAEGCAPPPANPEPPVSSNPGLGALGAECGDPSDCPGGECLADDAETPVCTRVCSGAAPCSADWFCDSVDGRSVCRPPLEAAGGCSVARVRRAAAPVTALFLFALGAHALGRRRSTRSRRPS